MLALDNDLLSQYFAFQQGERKEYNKDIITKLFKYLQPFTMSVNQKNEIGLADEVAQALSADGIIKIRNRSNEDDLIQKTVLKIMLTKDRVDGSHPYPYINILNDEVDVSFTATYTSEENRDKAREHIKALLLDANEISIYDKYLSANNSWNSNKQVLCDILPMKVMNIKIYCDIDWTASRENDLVSSCHDWIITKEDWDKNMHDRYVETDRVIILLSSGIINLLYTDKSKDFTYIVKVK